MLQDPIFQELEDLDQYFKERKPRYSTIRSERHKTMESMSQRSGFGRLNMSYQDGIRPLGSTLQTSDVAALKQRWNKTGSGFDRLKVETEGGSVHRLTSGYAPLTKKPHRCYVGRGQSERRTQEQAQDAQRLNCSGVWVLWKGQLQEGCMWTRALHRDKE